MCAHPAGDKHDMLQRLARVQRAVLRLQLDNHTEFLAILDAIRSQIQSREPDVLTVGCLGDALLQLAWARGVDLNKLRLPQLLHGLVDSVLESQDLWTAPRSPR